MQGVMTLNKQVLNDFFVTFLLVACIQTGIAQTWEICKSSEDCGTIWFRFSNTTDNENITIQFNICSSAWCNETHPKNTTFEIICESEYSSLVDLPEGCNITHNDPCNTVCNDVLEITTASESITQTSQARMIEGYVADVTTVESTTAEVSFTESTRSETTVNSAQTEYTAFRTENVFHTESTAFRTEDFVNTESTAFRIEETSESNDVDPDGVYKVIVFISIIFLMFLILLVCYFLKRMKLLCFGKSPPMTTGNDAFRHAPLDAGPSACSVSSAEPPAKIPAKQSAARNLVINIKKEREQKTAGNNAQERGKTQEPRVNYEEISIQSLVASHSETKVDDVTRVTSSLIVEDGPSKGEVVKKVVIDDANENPKTPIKSQYSTVLDAVAPTRKASRHNYHEVFTYPTPKYSSLQDIREAKVKRTSNYDSLQLGKTFVNPYSPASSACKVFKFELDSSALRSMSQSDGQSPKRQNMELKGKRLSRTLGRPSMRGNRTVYDIPMTSGRKSEASGQPNFFASHDDEGDFVTLRPRSADSNLGGFKFPIVESPSFNKDDDSDYEEL